MSDTVKLIIEIPKVMYESVQKKTYCGSIYPYLEKAIPLDDVKADIDQYLFQNEFGSEYRKEVLQIIDKYKAESEDKE